MDLIFNELSLEPALDQEHEARQIMSSLVETLAAAVGRRLIASLRMDSQFLGRALTARYRMSDWLNDRAVDLEAKRLIQTTATKAPYLESLLDQLQDDRLAEFRYHGRVAIGLGAAVLLGEATLSASREDWRIDPVTVDAAYLNGESLTNEQHDVCNVYSSECWTRRRVWFEERTRAGVKTGADILADSNGLFRWLPFGDAARDQLTRYRGSEPEFSSVVHHLVALSRHAEAWLDGAFADGYPFQCSPDSEATLDQYGTQRIFNCPDGTARRFSWHSKVNIKATRIYFHAARPGEPVVIGYIGPHLDTVKG